MRAFILAGGFATRLWPLTESRAKPLLPLAGKPILNYIVEQIPADMPVIISTNAALENGFREWQKTIDRANVTIRVEHTRSDDEKLGTLGATAQWIEEDKIDDDILLLTGDNYFGFTMSDFIDAFDGKDALVAAYDIGEKTKASAFGTIITEGKVIKAFEEKPKEPKTSLVSTGASILPKSVIPALIAYAKVKPDNVGGIFEELLRLGKIVHCFTFSEPWFDIGSFEAYLEATRTLVGDNVLKGEATTVERSECAGSCVIGDRTTIRDSRLRDTVIFGNATIDDCILENCIIDDGCTLKGIDLTGKMLRAGTRLVRE